MDHDPYAPVTCETLLLRIRDPLDTDAWRLFVDTYTPLIYRYAQRRGLQEADARDVVQDVLIRVNRAIRCFDYDPQRGRFRAWLGTIAAHVVLDHLQMNCRRNRHNGNGSDDAQITALEGANDPVWLDEYWLQLMRTALDCIRDEFDGAVWLAFEETWLYDQPAPEVARDLGETAAWVYKAKFTVLARLKVELHFLADDVALCQQT